MAIRTKTIEYAFPFSELSVATAVVRRFTNIAVNIPETTSRTFRSVIVEYTCYDNATVAASVTAVNLGATVGVAAESAATITQTITNSGENQSFYFTKNITAYFQTNFTGTSQTVGAAITITGLDTINASAKIIITYDYDDSSAITRIKTVKIPVDGSTTNLTATLADIGGLASQIPALDTFLPESTKVYRSIFFESFTNTGTTAAASGLLNIAYNGTTVSDTAHAATLVSDIFYKRIDVIDALINKATTNSLQVSVSSVTGKPCPCICGVIVVTYEYNHSSSTRIINSVQQPIMEEAGLSGATTIADTSRFKGTIDIQEPGTITLVQSGIMASYVASGAVTVDFRIGAQPSRTFAHAATVRGGSLTHMRRVDSGAVGGVGLTLSRGINTFTCDWFASTLAAGTIPSNMSGLLFLNYISDKHTLGDGVHKHTTNWCITPYSTGFTTGSGMIRAASATTPIIQETYYYIDSVGYSLILQPHGVTQTSIGVAFLGEVQSIEYEGAGWRAFYDGMIESDAEVGPVLMYARATDDVKAFPNDTNGDRLDIELARTYRYDNNLTATTTLGCIWQSQCFITYHTIPANVTISITGVTGSYVKYDAYRVSDGLKIGSGSGTADGTYVIPWYNNTENVVVTAYSDATHKGVSIEQPAGNTFTINLVSVDPTYYAFV